MRDRQVAGGLVLLLTLSLGSAGCALPRGSDTTAAPAPRPHPTEERPAIGDGDGTDPCATPDALPLRVPPLVIPDPLERAAAGQLPTVTPELQASTEVEVVGRWASLADYVADMPGGQDVSDVYATGVDAGFRRGIDVDLRAGPEQSNVRLLQLADAEASAGYLHAHLARLCDPGTRVEPLPIGNGIVVADPEGSASAIFVVGDIEVSAYVCVCSSDPDTARAASRWGERLTAYLSEGEGGTGAAP